MNITPPLDPVLLDFLSILKKSRKHGVKSDELNILAFIASEDSPPTMGSIAEELTLSNPAITGRIDSLVKKKLVTRQIPDGLRNRVCVHLTKKGTKFLTEFLK